MRFHATEKGPKAVCGKPAPPPSLSPWAVEAPGMPGDRAAVPGRDRDAWNPIELTEGGRLTEEIQGPIGVTELGGDTGAVVGVVGTLVRCFASSGESAARLFGLNTVTAAGCENAPRRDHCEFFRSVLQQASGSAPPPRLQDRLARGIRPGAVPAPRWLSRFSGNATLRGPTIVRLSARSARDACGHMVTAKRSSKDAWSSPRQVSSATRSRSPRAGQNRVRGPLHLVDPAQGRQRHRPLGCPNTLQLRKAGLKGPGRLDRSLEVAGLKERVGQP